MRSLFIPTLFFCLSTLAQNPVFSWAKHSSSSESVYSQELMFDAAGNIYTYLFFQDTVDLDSGPGTYTVVGFPNYSNLALVKLDGGGNFIWGKSMKVNLGGLLEGVLDEAGNIYLTASFTDSADFDPGPGVNLHVSAPPYYTAFCAKYRSNGDLVWARSFDGNCDSYKLAIDDQANICLAGKYRDKVDFDPGPATYTLESINKDQSYVAKLDSSGQFLWVKDFVGPVYNYCFNVTFDTAGCCYATGEFRGAVDFDPGPGNTTLTGGIGDYYLVKLDQQGNFVFAKQWYGWITNVAIDRQNNVNVGLALRPGITDLDPGAGTFNVNTPNNDCAIIRLDDQGNFSWAKSSGGNMGATKYMCDRMGDILISGTFIGLMDFDFGVGTHTVMGTALPVCFILLLDQSGNFKWVGIMEAVGNVQWQNPHIGAHGYFDDKGNIYLNGIFTGQSCDLDPTAGTYTLSGQRNRFLGKLSRCLNSGSAGQPIITCSNSETVTLSAQGSGTINWYNSYTATTQLGSGSNFVTPLLPAGNHTFYAEASPCAGQYARTPFFVQVNPSPTTQVTASPPEICVGEVVNIQLTGASAYSLNGVASASGFTAAPLTTTIFMIVGESADHCKDTVLHFQRVEICAGLEEPKKTDPGKLWPNPATDQFYVEIQGTAQITVFSLSGSKLIESKVVEQGSVDISTLTQGIYVVEIIGVDQRQTRIKLVKW